MTKNESKPPVEKNQTIVLDITSFGSDGQGVGRHEGFVVFVPFALPGERVEALIIKVASGYAVGKLVNVLQASPARTKPRCGVFGRCGGCQLQHMGYEAQLAFKYDVVAGALKSIGGIAEPPAVLPVIGMEDPWHYRNKGIFPVGQGSGGIEMGMYAPRSHSIVNVEDCPLQQEETSAAMAAVRRWAVRNSISAYNEATGRGLLRSVLVRTFGKGGTLVAVVTNGTALPYAEDLVEELRRSVTGLTGVVQNVNEDDTNVVLGKREKTLWGEPGAKGNIGELSYMVGARSFFQVNTLQTQRLYSAAADMAGLAGNELLVDAYCGVGTIGQYMAGRAGKVIGIESVPESVEEARRSAERNGIKNAEYICGRAEEVFPGLAQKGLKPDVILMDPPRKGCDERFLDAVAKTGAGRLVYVSCNPATLARDVKYLAGKGYLLKQVQPVDMFPQTADVECVALMSRVTS